MRLMRFGCAVCLIILALPSFVFAGEKIALVIGNSDYSYISKLKNPENDARLISKRLESLGFVVDQQYDLKLRETQKILRKFRKKANEAELALIYYAGHAVSVDGVNYVISIDSEIEDKEDLQTEAVTLKALLASGDGVPNFVAFIDACRNNPYKNLTGSDGKYRSALDPTFNTRGLSRLSSSEARNKNRFIGMAAGTGEVALDGSGENSPFALALTKHLDEKMSVDQLFKKVTKSVRQSTNDTQNPQTLDNQMEDNICLAGSCTGQRDIETEAASLFKIILQSATRDVAMYNSFLASYEGTAAAREAKIKLQSIISNQTTSNSTSDMGSEFLVKAETRYFNGFTDTKAFDLFMKAGENGAPAGYIKAAHMLADGIGVKKDVDRARTLADAALPAVQEDAKTNPKAYYYLGLASQFGLGTGLDFVEAAALTEKGAKASDPLALNSMGWNYDQGTGVAKDKDKALAYFISAADLGLAVSMNSAGQIYRVDKSDYVNAMRWYRKADENGNPKGTFYIGYLYDVGLGVEEDNAEAAKWYRKSADLGHAQANANLGNFYLSGIDVEKDGLKAKAYFEKAFNINPKSAYAARKLGDLYQKGIGVKASKELAIQWYETAGELGNLASYIEIGDIYSGEMNMARDLDGARAEEYYQKALDLGSAEGGANIAYLYEKGIGVVEDDTKAAGYYETAANDGVEWAAQRLGRMYRFGEGVEKSGVKAAEYFNRAIEINPGSTRGYDNLGELYRFGAGDLWADDQKSAAYYEKSADLGKSSSLVAAGLVYSDSRPRQSLEENYELAIEYYTRALQKPDLPVHEKRLANRELGEIYFNDTTSLKDQKRAYNYFKKAAELKSGQSYFYLAWMDENNYFGTSGKQEKLRAGDYYFKSLKHGSSMVFRQDGKRWDLSTAKRLQSLLKDAGAYDGAIDGQIGSGSISAMKTYCGCG